MCHETVHIGFRDLICNEAVVVQQLAQHFRWEYVFGWYARP